MLGQRRRRWASIKQMLDQRVVFAGDVMAENCPEKCGAKDKL